jgi:aminoglycoside phosphotransferase (APT) family kinase protein
MRRISTRSGDDVSVPAVPPDEIHLIERILVSCRLEALAVQVIAQGSTSRVWRADTPGGSVVVRLAVPAQGKSVGFDADVGVRTRMYRADDRVAQPLASGRADLPNPNGGPAVPWCVDRYIAGQTAPRGAIPEQVCQDLGQVLSRLHALPVKRYGLLEDRQDMLVGQELDPVTGLLSRLQDPWPFTPLSLADHPLIRAAPELRDRLAPLEDGLRALVTSQRCCLNHTDLHEGQLLIADGRLAGLIDFGDVTVGPLGWDIASFAYFHGWYLAQAMLNGYTHDAHTRNRLLADARQFAPLIALHHASRSVTLRRPQRLQYAIQFLHLAWPQ